MLDRLREWQGTADDLSEVLRSSREDLGLSIEPPAPRTVRLWRSKQIFSQEKGKPFRYRQILEGLATAILLKKGWTLVAIAETLTTFSEVLLEKQIVAESRDQDPIWSANLEKMSAPLPVNPAINLDLAQDAVILLAQGIELLYTRVLDEEFIVRQDDQLSPEICQAMRKLGRLYIEEGLTDEAACVHTLLDRARYPLNHQRWNLKIFHQDNFPFSRVTLIDSELRVPTLDCGEIARSSGGFGENNVIERRLYNQLKEMTERLGGYRQHQAYTALRRLFGKFSLIEERELGNYLEENDLFPLHKQVIEKFFDPVPELWLIKGKAHRCANCGTLLHPHPSDFHGRCPFRCCVSHNLGQVSEKLDPDKNLLIAKPPILTYWTAPALDELAIYDAAILAGLDARLYPESDRCDVAIENYSIGIDAKSYSSPVTLALRLNRSIGGLIDYKQRIIAISDWLIEDYPDYISILRQTLNSQGDAATLEILSVRETIKYLRGLNYAS